jgi:hypothetical protein
MSFSANDSRAGFVPFVPGVGLHAPDRVQCCLKFQKCTSGRDDESDAANDGGENAGASLAGALEKILHGAHPRGQ